jgi:hypothetical protein
MAETDETPTGLRRWLPAGGAGVALLLLRVADRLATASDLTVDLPNAAPVWRRGLNASMRFLDLIPDGVYDVASLLLCIVVLLLVLRGARRAIGDQQLPEPEPVPAAGFKAGASANAPSRLADSLVLRRDRMSVRLLRRVDSHNPGEVAGFAPKVAFRLIRLDSAVERHASLRRAVKRVLLELEELKRAYSRQANDEELTRVRAGLADAIELYFKEVVAFDGPAEATAHRRVWMRLVEAHDAESRDPGMGIMRYADPVTELREWDEEYERVRRFWELDA